MKKIKIKLVKSVIGAHKKHKQTVLALGLKRINQVVEKSDTEAIQGMIRKVSHLVKVI